MILTFRQAIRNALHDEMKRDSTVFLMGEDIGTYGGCFQVTKGLLDIFGQDRVLETPVSEEGFTGVAVGAAMTGLRPVVEIMYADFSTLAADPLINHAAKIHFLSAGQFSCPLVFRAPFGGGTGHGAQHTQSMESLFINIPGLKLVAPASVQDAYGLLISAMRDENPVLFFEHKMLYDVQQGVEELVPVPLGKAKVVREGTDVSIITYSRMVSVALTAAAELSTMGISAEVIDLRSLKPLDVETIRASAKKTNHVLAVHEAPAFGGMSGEIFATVRDICPKTDRVGAKELPLPFSPSLEALAVPSVAEIKEAALCLIRD